MGYFSPTDLLQKDIATIVSVDSDESIMAVQSGSLLQGLQGNSFTSAVDGQGYGGPTWTPWNLMHTFSREHLKYGWC